MTRVLSLERLLPLACLAAAVALFASDLMTTFQLTPPGGEPLCAQEAVDRHHYALAVLAVFSVGALLGAVAWGSKPAAIGVAVAGILALLIFLIADLPKANNLGTVNDACGPQAQSFFEAKAVPQAGFWLELVGALSLTISGAALATLTPEQLAALRPSRRRKPEDQAVHADAEKVRRVREAEAGEDAQSGAGRATTRRRRP